MYLKFFKRIIDFFISLVAIVVISPVLVFVAILVRIKLGGPVIFKQKRPGKNEKIFTMYKFRTMSDERDKNGDLLPDPDRLTKFGKMLRATSLDELPELFNILIGDMSLVGPRPQLVRDMVFMTEKQRTRHCVLPGLTGWAQINGRNNVSWEEKLSFDLDYIEEISFAKDFNIIILTVAKVLKKDDITANGMDTAEDLGDYLLRSGKVNKVEYEKNQKLSKELLMKE